MVCRNGGPLTIFLLIGCFVTSGLTEYKKKPSFPDGKNGGSVVFHALFYELKQLA